VRDGVPTTFAPVKIFRIGGTFPTAASGMSRCPRARRRSRFEYVSRVDRATPTSHYDPLNGIADR